MAHMLEIVKDKAGNEVAKMAYAGETPWHGLGKKVPSDLTPEQMCEAAGLDYEVKKFQTFVRIKEKHTRVELGSTTGKPVPQMALVRMGDEPKILSMVTGSWEPVQNKDAFDFFNEFVMAGNMEMETAGSLDEGRKIWAMARIKGEGFELFGGDRVVGNLLFTNFHQYGCSTDIRFTPTRVVCNNTLTLALGTKSDHMVKIDHRRKWTQDLAREVKEVLGVSHVKMEEYRERAEFLGSKRAKKEDVIEYFNRLFPGSSKKEKMSQQAHKLSHLLDVQPGTEFAPGTWWQAFNAVTFGIDHVFGKNRDTALASSWYGSNRANKHRALNMAIDYADAS